MREPAAAPKPIRNDVMQPAEEVLVLRDHALRLGSHRQYFEWAVSDLRARRPLGATRRRRWWSMLQPVR